MEESTSRRAWREHDRSVRRYEAIRSVVRFLFWVGACLAFAWLGAELLFHLIIWLFL